MQTLANVLVVFGLCLGLWQYSLIHGKEVAEGTVTANEIHVGGGSGKNRTYRLNARFLDHAGAERTYRANFGAISTGFEVGDRIRIYFDRENPSDCGVLSFGYRFGIAWGFILAGLALSLFLAGPQLGNPWLERLIPTTARDRYEAPAKPGG
jgi:hypothetical protein